MTIGGWIAVAAAAWVVIAVLVALLVGRMVRLRERQVPEDAPHAEPGVPPQRGRTQRRRP